ncbi:hypothetical protein AO715_04120 [Xanthomonas sp. Mitacek01]|nr:hypothetical protein AO715_04120 [Xanthomonas sp. Mitacek01]
MRHEDPAIDVSRQAGGLLYVRVRGTASFDNAVAYWNAIADAIEDRPAQLLLLIDELRGPAMSEAQWKQLVAEVGPRLGQLRIAHVKPHGLDTVEYCVLSAMGAGLDARVFEDERMASLWLRYGSPET